MTGCGNVINPGRENGHLVPNLAAGRVQFGPERRSSESPGDGETKAGIPKSPFKLMERAQTACQQNWGKRQRSVNWVFEGMPISHFVFNVF